MPQINRQIHYARRFLFLCFFAVGVGSIHRSEGADSLSHKTFFKETMNLLKEFAVLQTEIKPPLKPKSFFNSWKKAKDIDPIFEHLVKVNNKLENWINYSQSKNLVGTSKVLKWRDQIKLIKKLSQIVAEAEPSYLPDAQKALALGLKILGNLAMISDLKSESVKHTPVYGYWFGLSIAHAFYPKIIQVDDPELSIIRELRRQRSEAVLRFLFNRSDWGFPIDPVLKRTECLAAMNG